MPIAPNSEQPMCLLRIRYSHTSWYFHTMKHCSHNTEWTVATHGTMGTSHEHAEQKCQTRQQYIWHHSMYMKVQTMRPSLSEAGRVGILLGDREVNIRESNVKWFPLTVKFSFCGSGLGRWVNLLNTNWAVYCWFPYMLHFNKFAGR